MNNPSQIKQNDEDAKNDLEQFLPRRPGTPLPPSERKFRPWHKPRKQYIRKKQWLYEIERLIESIDLPIDNKVFRYLTLPSEDMIDIRVLGENLTSRNLKLKYLGYFKTDDQSLETRMNIAENDIKGSTYIHDSSIVVRELLEETAVKESIAYNALREHGPFHAINIDLCNHFAFPPKNAKTCVDAINSIVNLQVSRHQSSWLLFLTTRVEPECVDRRHFAAFLSAIVDNMKKSTLFKDRLSSVLSTHEITETLEFDEAKKMPISEFKDFFCIGFGKWLLSFLSTAIPQVKVEMLPSYYYSVHAKKPDMLSLAYKFSLNTTLPTDNYNLISNQTENTNLIPANESEIQSGIQIIQETLSLTDLDTKLLIDSDEMERMREDSKVYLKKAGYDIARYNEFIAGIS